MEVTNEVKISILEMELRAIYNTIYQLTVKAQVLKEIGDEAKLPPIQKELETLVKLKDKYEERLKALKPEVPKEEKPNG